jgi:serine/threonine protein kinase
LAQLGIIAAAARLACRPAARRSWGRFTDLALVGEGGYGRVYRARDPVLDRDVALKLLKDPGADPRSGDALIREARRLARVRHPNVITVYGAERVDDEVGIWMEFVEGTTLRDALADSTDVEPHRVMQIGVELCAALDAVHALGLVHGDVKPGNVLVSHDGRILLSDFGAGRGLADDAETLRATLSYAAPEVLSGHAPTPHSDLYSLGVLLQALAGDRVTMLRDVLDTATAAAPEDRFRDARAFSQALTGAGKAPRGWQRPQRALAVTVAAVTLALALTYTPWETEKADVSPRARQLYLQGQLEWNKRTREGLRQAMDRFDAALVIEPEYADAWSGIALTFVLQSAYNFMPKNEALPRAIAAAERALKIDARIADAHVALGYVRVQQGQLLEGERIYRRAIELDPANVTAHHWYGLTRTRENAEEGLRHLQRAYELDPLSRSISTDLAHGLIAAGRLDDAVVHYQRVIEVFPEYLDTRVQLAELLIEVGKVTEAEQQARVVLERDPVNVGATHAYIESLRLTRRSEDLLALRARIERAPDAYPAWTHARIAAATGDVPATLHWIRRGAAEHAEWIGAIRVVPYFAAVRDHPDVREIVRTYLAGVDAATRATVDDRPSR